MKTYEYNEFRISEALAENNKTIDELLEGLDNIKDTDIGLPEFIGIGKNENKEKHRKIKFQAILAKYQDKICKNEDVIYLSKDPTADRRITLICAIADLLAFSGALTVATLIVREGINSFCKKHW